jgi:hypothetical protein
MPARKNGTATWRVVLHHFSGLMMLFSVEVTVSILATLCKDPAPGLDGANPQNFSSRFTSCGSKMAALATGIVDLTASFTEPRETSMSVDNTGHQ